MPEVQHVYPAPLHPDTIKHVERSVEQAPDVAKAANGSSHQRETPEQINVSQERVSELCGSARMPMPGPGEQSLQII